MDKADENLYNNEINKGIGPIEGEKNENISN
jgi:hypothetical protein